MSNGIIGADVEQLHQLGDQLKMKPADIEALINAGHERARPTRPGRARPGTASRASGTRRSGRRSAG